MLVSGILQCVFWVAGLVAALSYGLMPACGCMEFMTGLTMSCAGLACLTFIPMFVINVLMLDEWAKSDKECGPPLWRYGAFIIVMIVFNACCGPTVAQRKTN